MLINTLSLALCPFHPSHEKCARTPTLKSPPLFLSDEHVSVAGYNWNM